MSVILYQFPISHFCEKVRFALDHKGIDHQIKNLVPGLHTRTTLKKASQSSVPLLEHDGRSIQGSEQIISYLDQQFPDNPLTPAESDLAQQALNWERYLDKEIGVHVRRYAYHTLLDHPDLVIGFFATNGRFWAKPFLKMSFPRIQGVMRKLMKINSDSAEQSRLAVRAALEKLNQGLDGKDYLVGNQFSRADLTAVSLLAPLTMPPQYGLNWPQQLPEPLQAEVESLADQLQWARNIYSRHR